MNQARSPRRGRRLLRIVLTALLPLAAITCLNDRPTGPGGHARASFNVRRVARGGAACGPAPVITPAKARVLLRERGHTDSVVAVADFVGDSVTLTVDVPLAGATALFDISAQAIDAFGDTVFRARDTVTAKAGDRSTVGYLALWYSAPDSALQTLALVPRDSLVRIGGGFSMRAGGTVQGGGAFAGRIRLGWVSRDLTIATVGQDGAVTALNKPGSAWLVAATWLGLCDSTTVVIVPPVASVTLTPDTADIARDGTIQLVAVLKDAGGNTLTGRAIAWSSTNANASVDTAGLVKGLVANKSARIIANSEGVADTSGIGVLGKPVGKVTITPKTGGVVDVGATLALTVAVLDSVGVADPDFPVTWVSLNTTLATVNGTGVVTGVKSGSVLITATSDGVADTATVTVNPVGITSTVVTPTPDTLFSINDSLQLVAKSFTGVTPTPGVYVWTSRDPTVVTVNATGLVVAKKNGVTYVVADEAGGTKDSALVNVIQKVSSITVLPTPVTRYLGTKQQFTANALDARGSPVAGTTFVWSSSDPSIAVPDATGFVPTMLAIGPDTIKATAGTVVGKAVLNVISAITRIAVTPSPVTLDAINKTQAYTAVAHDTLDAVMPGINFTWASSNPGVATVPGTVGTTQTATAAANGLTAIVATAQQVNGSASLTVAQKLVSIVAGPDPTTIGQGGQAQLSARGKDANGFFIPGGVFSWASDAPTNVSVGAATGIVKGLATPPASAHITATSGVINSNPVLVLVDNSVPPKISWAKDTLAIGRGSLNNSLPLYLSKPSATPVTVTVAVKDTFAYFSPTTVNFAAGVTTANANLNGRNAGVTEVYATDLSAQYNGDTSVLLVQANARFTVAGYSINATDYQSTQVLLTDPAPAGGVYLAMSYGTAGIAQVSPDPAFIPVGQLAANVNINGLAAGITTVTPTAPGISGTSTSVNIGPPVLLYSTGAQRIIGAGQYEPNDYVYAPRNLFHPLPLDFASTDTTIATSPTPGQINAGISYSYFTLFAPRVGVITQTVSSPGWTPAVRTVRVSTPHVGMCCATSMNTTSAPRLMTSYSEDSLGTQHYRINPLFVTYTSTDTTIVQVMDTTVTIGSGSYFNSTGRFKPGGNGGVAYIRATAGGHTADSIQVTVVAPNLAFSFATGVIGTDQYDNSYQYISIPNAVGSAVTVTLTSNDTSIAYVTPLLTIPAGTNYAYFVARGHALGAATIIATAAGYSPDTAKIVVSTPRLQLCCGFTVPLYSPPRAMTAYTLDSLGTARYVLSKVTVSLTSTNGNATPDSTSVDVPAGLYYNQNAKVVINSLGTSMIKATAPGYKPDSFNVTINAPKLGNYMNVGSIGLRQHIGPNGAYTATPNPRPVAVPVTITNLHPTIAGAPASVSVPVNQNIGYFDYNGIALGRDTLVFSSPTYIPDSGVVLVTRAALVAAGLGANYTTTSLPVSIYASSYDTIGYGHYNMDTVAVLVTSTDTTVMKVDSAIIHINKDKITSNFAKVTFVGPGSARVTFVDSAGLYRSDSSVLVTVTGPSLHISAGTTLGSPVTLGMRQHLGVNGIYVYLDNAVVGQPLTVNLLSTDTKVASVPATVTIPVGQNIGYFDIIALDTTGTIQIKLTATGYAPVVSFVQVGQPKFAVFTNLSSTTTSPPTAITVYAEDQAGNVRYTTEDVVVTLGMSNGSVANPDSATVTIKKDLYYHNTSHMRYLSPGTTTLTASDARVKFYKYDPVTSGTIIVSLPQVTIGLGASTNVGLDEVIDTYVQIPNALASDLVVTLSHTNGGTTTPSTVTILAGQNTSPFRIVGASKASDDITTSAGGHTGKTYTLAVDAGQILLSGWPASVKVGDSVAVTLYTQDQAGAGRTVGIPITFSFAPNSNVEFRQGGAVINSIIVPANASNSPTFYVKGLIAGTGSALVRGGRFTAYSNTLTVTP